MMVKEKSNPWMRTKALLVVMMATITLCSFSTPELHKQVGIIAEKMQETNEKILRIIKRIEYLQQLRIPEDKIAKIIAKKKERTEKHTVERRETVKSNTEETNKVFDVVDEMPEFPGGMQALIQYLTNTVKYPEESESKGEQGRVICTFVVEADGKVSNTMIAKGVTPALDKEAERVVRSMPNWTPGKLNGQNVRVKYTLPVTFMFQ
jgi:TonB family protein